MSKILIAGCGYVGCALAERLVSNADSVWGLRRRVHDLPLGVQPIEADLSVARTLRDLPPGLDFVVYAASPSGLDDAYYRTAYVEGPTRLLEALDAQQQRPRRIFFLSSTSVYAQHKGEWVDEGSPTEPAHFSGRRVLEGEQRMRDSAYATTVLRLGGIYGPRRTSLIERVRAGQATYAKGAARYMNRIHRDDICGAILHLMRLESPERTYNVVDDEPAEESVVLRWLAGVLGAPEPRAGKEAEPSGRRGLSNKRVRNARLRESGYALAYPTFREGYAALLEGKV